VNLNAIAQDLDSMLRRLIPEDISIQTVPSPGLNDVLADPGQVEQVILNLVVNARDAMPNGGKLTIETANVELDETYCRRRNEVKPGQYVLLAISDTGTGMDAKTQAKIFEPFFTTKEVGKGTGLGLSTVYGIVKQSNGHIEVYSEVGKGTVFKVYLPQAPTAAKTAHLSATHKSVASGNETILLVEDDPGVQELAKDILEMNGYAILTATNGSAALKIFAEQKDKISLVLTDVVMPEMGGPELVKRLQKLRPDLKVLFTSGYPDRAVVHNGSLTPNVNFIQKPYAAASLATKVRDILDKG
jgi:two-component system cell cycle sensor histidine kinase/response regulator CckA